MELTHLSSTELLASLDSVWNAGNRALAEMLAYLGEVERRRLYVDMACSSMFAFVERRFGLTGGSAYRRLTAARLALRFPSILPRVERGELGLEALCTLKDVLTEANVDDLLAATAGKTARHVEHLVACLAPKPDAAASIRKLPVRLPTTGAIASSANASVVIAAGAMASGANASSIVAPGVVRSGANASSSNAVGASASNATCRDARDAAAGDVASTADSSTVKSTVSPVAATPLPTPTPSPSPRGAATRPRFEQLSEARHKVQLTVSSETRAKVERARALMKHRLPSGDLEGLFDQAIDALIEKLERSRLGKTSRPRRRSRPSAAGHVAAAVRREVFARDGEQCAFVSASGERCGTSDFLELDHATPRARGGPDAASNLRVVCRAHNRRYAEVLFGADYVAAKIASHGPLGRITSGSEVNTSRRAPSHGCSLEPRSRRVRPGVDRTAPT